MTPITCAKPSPPRARSPLSPTPPHVRSNIRTTSISMPSAIWWNAASQSSSNSAASQPASKKPPEITLLSSPSQPLSYGCGKCPHYLEHPGLSAATFRTATTDSPEWRQAALELSKFVLCVFAEAGLDGAPAQHAIRMLRSLVRGFVLNEMAASFLEPLDYEESFKLVVDAFILGLPAFTPEIKQARD